MLTLPENLLLLKAFQLESAAQMSSWLRVPGPEQSHTTAFLLTAAVCKIHMFQVSWQGANLPSEPELILTLHTLLQAAVSLQELQTASEQDLVLAQFCTFIREGWPARVLKKLAPFYRIKGEVSGWNTACLHEDCGQWFLAP